VIVHVAHKASPVRFDGGPGIPYPTRDRNTYQRPNVWQSAANSVPTGRALPVLQSRRHHRRRLSCAVG
jgi:hypothetical protein